MSVWKRNAVVVAIVLFVGAAVYLNWSYSKEAAEGADGENGGKLLGQTTLVNGENTSKDSEAGKSETGKGETGKGETGKGETDDKGSAAQASESPDAEGSQVPENTSSTGYFASARLNRQQARDSALDLLQQAAADENAQQTVVDEANATIQAMAALTVSEAKVENLITAKGYGDCVCFINDNSASVVVSSTENGLSENDVNKIMEIVKEETGLAAGKITVIETEP
jgi:stage III sporulation protein AH